MSNSALQSRLNGRKPLLSLPCILSNQTLSFYATSFFDIRELGAARCGHQSKGLERWAWNALSDLPHSRQTPMLIEKGKRAHEVDEIVFVLTDLPYDFKLFPVIPVSLIERVLDRLVDNGSQ